MAKAQGRGSAEWIIVGVLLAVHCRTLLASAATWTVGGSQGWTIGPNYTNWAAGQSYTTGDVLFFRYANGGHNVVEVNQSDYDACSVTTAIATYTDGNTNVTLNATGTHYFLCSFPLHCSAGMKLAVTVGAAATPAPAPITSVGTAAPAPATTPVAAPVPSPASVGTPSTTPAGTPSTSPVPSPASVGTPSTTPAPSPASVGTPSTSPAPSPGTPTSASSPPSMETPGSLTAPPPSPAASLPSPASLVAALLGLSAALLAL